MSLSPCRTGPSLRLHFLLFVEKKKGGGREGSSLRSYLREAGRGRKRRKHSGKQNVEGQCLAPSSSISFKEGGKRNKNVTYEEKKKEEREKKGGKAGTRLD